MFFLNLIINLIYNSKPFLISLKIIKLDDVYFSWIGKQQMFFKWLAVTQWPQYHLYLQLLE